jgi:glycosyltransferase involved in cell wall biosynthesis
MLSIIIPAYNAENTIKQTLDDYYSYYSRSHYQQFEILVMANGCTDKTVDVVKGYMKPFPEIKLWSFGGKIGKGATVIEGFKIASGDIVSFVDADNSTRPGELNKLIEALTDEYDAAIGSRWLPASDVPVKQPLSRRIASRGFNALVRVLFGMSFADTQCGAKVFRKNVLRRVIPELNSPGWAFDVELLWRVVRHNFHVREVPICWEDSVRSTLKIKTAVPSMLSAIIRLRLSESSARYFLEEFSLDAPAGFTNKDLPLQSASPTGDSQVFTYFNRVGSER